MNFVFLSTMKWGDYEGAFAPVQIAAELARRGHRIVFVQNLALDSTVHEPNVKVLGLEELGVPRVVMELAGHGVYVGALDEVLTPLANLLAPDAPWIVVLNSPFDPFVRLLPFFQERGDWLVYYAQDNYAAMFELGYTLYNPTQERKVVRCADLVLTLSEPVAEKLSNAGRTVQVVPDAVDPNAFRKSASGTVPDILRGAECTLGFWGTLTAPMFDAELVEAVARSHPQWAFNLIGRYDLASEFRSLYERLAALPNVRFHGRVNHNELARYASAFDVMLIPAPDNDFSRGRDPLKLYEYLSAYKPVVASHMPQLRGAPYTYFGDTPDEFACAVQNAQKTLVEHKVVDTYLAQHTWGARTDAFLTHIHAMQQTSRGSHGMLDMQALENAGKQQPVSALGMDEWTSVVYALREWSKQAAELPKVQSWARELEATNRAQAQELPTRLAQQLKGIWRK